jgi:UDP-N-acetylmuramoylalanine-D-glutamate ligase
MFSWRPLACLGSATGGHLCRRHLSNITHDHLDYHKTFDEYLSAKKLFFDGMPRGTFACINADDRNGRLMVQNTKASVHYYGIRSMADFKGRIVESHMDGTLLNFDNQEFWTRFIASSMPITCSQLMQLRGYWGWNGRRSENLSSQH